ncbi:MAG TPA: hypothetical protein VNL77_13990 [Roseiflexaceae bacterium]|nr:hypothetical protein [Roseiflexaceae bacterium]
MHALTLIANMLPHVDLASSLPLFHVFAGPPINPDKMIIEIADWLVKILAAVGFLFLIIDLFKHVVSSPRDLGAAGKDIFVMCILLAVAARAQDIVTWAQGLL